jgi:hypothetical protein
MLCYRTNLNSCMLRPEDLDHPPPRILTEQNYSGDFGDLASFATHMRSIAASKGSDFLIM